MVISLCLSSVDVNDDGTNMARTSDAKAKMMATAEALFRTQGIAATGLTQILEESGAPKGSFYHHFPGGKDQMLAEALDGYMTRGEGLIRHIVGQAGPDTGGFVTRLCVALANDMERGGWSRGCLLQVTAAEMASADTEWMARLQRGARAWHTALAQPFVDAGHGEQEAHSQAEALMAALDGARTMARIERSRAPFEAVAALFASGGPQERMP
jgi:TetR/AcrR family transcriptional regulator, lmrAB and yxaGH operons repressor